MPYTGSPEERVDRRNASAASDATAKAADTEKLTNVAGLASKMSAPKRFWHMPTSRWVETDDPEYKTLQADKDGPKAVTAKSISAPKSISGRK